MPKELKVRINNVATLKQKLGEIGAKFERELREMLVNDLNYIYHGTNSRKISKNIIEL